MEEVGHLDEEEHEGEAGGETTHPAGAGAADVGEVAAAEGEGAGLWLPASVHSKWSTLDCMRLDDLERRCASAERDRAEIEASERYERCERAKAEAEEARRWWMEQAVEGGAEERRRRRHLQDGVVSRSEQTQTQIQKIRFHRVVRRWKRQRARAWTSSHPSPSPSPSPQVLSLFEHAFRQLGFETDGAEAAWGSSASSDPSARPASSASSQPTQLGADTISTHHEADDPSGGVRRRSGGPHHPLLPPGMALLSSRRILELTSTRTQTRTRTLPFTQARRSSSRVASSSLSEVARQRTAGYMRGAASAAA